MLSVNGHDRPPRRPPTPTTVPVTVCRADCPRRPCPCARGAICASAKPATQQSTHNKLTVDLLLMLSSVNRLSERSLKELRAAVNLKLVLGEVRDCIAGRRAA